jgi:putative oxidoreductase
MLNTFPLLLSYSFFSPLILRLAIGIIFISYGYVKLTSNRAKEISFFESIGFKPGKYYAFGFGVVEALIGLMLIVGLYTQIAALIAFIISLLCVIAKNKYPEKFPNQAKYYTLLLVISLSLMLSGAGPFAFDIPL